VKRYAPRLADPDLWHLKRRSSARRGDRPVQRAGAWSLSGADRAQWEHGGGFSVDASVRIEAADRAGCERLLRYCARPPFALDRLRELGSERLLYEVTKPGPGGGGSLRLTPLEMIDPIAALVPPPRFHRHRYVSLLVRTAAHRKFPWRPRTAGVGRLPPSAADPNLGGVASPAVG
jgi:hypothetical protein